MYTPLILASYLFTFIKLVITDYNKGLIQNIINKPHAEYEQHTQKSVNPDKEILEQVKSSEYDLPTIKQIRGDITDNEIKKLELYKLLESIVCKYIYLKTKRDLRPLSYL